MKYGNIEVKPNIFLIFISFFLLFESCSIQRRQFNSGLNIDWGSNRYQNRKTNSTVTLKTKLAHKIRVPEAMILKEVEGNIDSLGNPDPIMRLDDSYMNQFKKQSQLIHFLMYAKELKLHNRVTVKTMGNHRKVNGKLLAVSENGVFLYNDHPQTRFFKKTPRGKFQDSIHSQLYYLPYGEIKSVIRADAPEDIIQRSLVPLILIVGMLLTILGYLFSFRTSQDFNFGQDALGILLMIIAIIAFSIAAFFSVVLAVLGYLLLKIVQPIWILLSGNKWHIKGNYSKGFEFYQIALQQHTKFRLFEADWTSIKRNNVKPKVKKEISNDVEIKDSTRTKVLIGVLILIGITLAYAMNPQ